MIAKYTTPPHTNRNPIAAVWVDSSGKENEFHQPLRVCVLPVDHDFKASKVFMPFYVEMKPDNLLGNIDVSRCSMKRTELLEVCATGFTQEQGRMMFIEWFDQLNLGFNKWGSKQRQLIPLAYDWGSVRPFLMDWLGRDSFEVFFHNEWRDIRCAANYLNDKSWMAAAERVPYYKDDFPWLCKNTSNAIDSEAKNPIYLANKVAQVYRTLLTRDHLSLN